MDTADIVTRENAMTLPPTGGIHTAMIQTREMTEIQAMVISAKRFPRDLAQVRSDILASCDSPALAEHSQYEYSKGGTEITGASIRLAEELAGAFQNMDKGWVELERKSSSGNIPGESVIQAFAWDMQRNVKAKRTFTVRHWRDTKKGGYAIKDEREIYELCANQAARRLRACILELIPKFIQEEAIERCDATLKKTTGPLDKKIPEMLTAFGKMGVTKEMLEKFVQQKIETIDITKFNRLRKIYGSIADGMSKPEQWFEGASGGESTTPAAAGDGPGQAPATQSIAKKPAGQVGPQGPEMDIEAKRAQNAKAKVKNSAPTVEEIAAKKVADLDRTPPPQAADVVPPAEGFDIPTDVPAEPLPSFKEVWNNCAVACKALGWSPVRLAEFTKEKIKKSPADLQRADDVKALIGIYEMLLKEKST